MHESSWEEKIDFKGKLGTGGEGTGNNKVWRRWGGGKEGEQRWPELGANLWGGVES